MKSTWNLNPEERPSFNYISDWWAVYSLRYFEPGTSDLEDNNNYYAEAAAILQW